MSCLKTQAILYGDVFSYDNDFYCSNQQHAQPDKRSREVSHITIFASLTRPTDVTATKIKKMMGEILTV